MGAKSNGLHERHFYRVIIMAQDVLEKTLENLFKRLLDEKHIFHIKGISRGVKGFPDRKVFADNIYYVELKVGKEGGSYYKQTKMQKWWQDKIEKSNGHYVLLTGEQEIILFVNQLKPPLR